MNQEKQKCQSHEFNIMTKLGKIHFGLQIGINLIRIGFGIVFFIGINSFDLAFENLYFERYFDSFYIKISLI